MEHVTKNIFRWEGKSNRTPEEARAAAEIAKADMDDFIAHDPFVQSQLAAWKMQQETKLKANSQPVGA